MTVFRLQQFPNVCRVCLLYHQEDFLVPIDEYMRQYSVKIIDFLEELADPIPAELHHFTPSGVCLSCFEELNSFLAYRKRLNLVVKFISSLARVAKGQTSALEDLINEHREDLKGVLRQLNILEKDELIAQDLLDEFDQYCIGGMLSDEMSNDGQELLRSDGEPLQREGTIDTLEISIDDTDNAPDGCLSALDELRTTSTTIATEIVLLNQQNKQPVDGVPSEFNPLTEEERLLDHSNGTLMDVVSLEEQCIDGELGADDGLTGVKDHSGRTDQIEPQFSRTTRGNVKSKTKGDLLQCKTCKFQTFYAATFQLHMKKHQNKTFEPGFCTRCQLQFDSKRELIKHKRSTHRDYICDTCGMGFDCKFALFTHRTRHEDVRQYKCEYCPLEYYTKTELALHVRKTHLKAFEVNCPVCALTFKTKQTLNQHLKTHTGQRTHTCSTCGFSFKSHTHLNRHMKGVHQGVQFVCELCTTSYRRKDKLRLHMEKTHNIQTYFVCDICVQSFNSGDTLEKHKDHHRNPKDRQCGVCLGAFLTEQEFNDHLCITYRENYICCNRDFKFQSYYNKHKFLAHGEHTNVRVKPTDGLLMGQFRAMRRQEIRCPKCEQEFPTRNLKKHHMETCGLDVYEVQYIDEQEELDFQVASGNSASDAYLEGCGK